jgi:hypothetical protein
MVCVDTRTATLPPPYTVRLCRRHQRKRREREREIEREKERGREREAGKEE